MTISRERAETIRKSIWANHGWTTPGQVTAEEDREIKLFWNSLDGTTTYYDVICRMASGEHLQGENLKEG